MPQLDSNSFFYQYFGIIFLLVVIYISLSYVILPILLRTLVIKMYYIKLLNSSHNLSNFLPVLKQSSLNSKNKVVTVLESGISLILKKLVSKLGVLSLIFSKTKNKNKIENNINTTFLLNSYFSFLYCLFLLEEDYLND